MGCGFASRSSASGEKLGAGMACIPLKPNSSLLSGLSGVGRQRRNYTKDVLCRPPKRILLLFAAVFFSCTLSAQGPANAPTPLPGRLLLVLPFDNRTDKPNLDWISEAIPEVINRRLASAGFLPIGREDRLVCA